MPFQPVQLVAGTDDGRAVQVQSVLLCQAGQDSPARRGLIWAKAGGGVPVVGDDPHAEKVIAEVAERSAAIYGAPIGGKPPVLLQVWRCHAGHRESIPFRDLYRIPKGCTRCRTEDSFDHLPDAGVSLEVADKILREDTARVWYGAGLVW